MFAGIGMIHFHLLRWKFNNIDSLSKISLKGNATSGTLQQGNCWLLHGSGALLSRSALQEGSVSNLTIEKPGLKASTLRSEEIIPRRLIT